MDTKSNKGAFDEKPSLYKLAFLFKLFVGISNYVFLNMFIKKTTPKIHTHTHNSHQMNMKMFRKKIRTYKSMTTQFQWLSR